MRMGGGGPGGGRGVGKARGSSVRRWAKDSLGASSSPRGPEVKPPRDKVLAPSGSRQIQPRAGFAGAVSGSQAPSAKLRARRCRSWKHDGAGRRHVESGRGGPPSAPPAVGAPQPRKLVPPPQHLHSVRPRVRDALHTDARFRCHRESPHVILDLSPPHAGKWAGLSPGPELRTVVLRGLPEWARDRVHRWCCARDQTGELGHSASSVTRGSDRTDGTERWKATGSPTVGTETRLGRSRVMDRTLVLRRGPSCVTSQVRQGHWAALSVMRSHPGKRPCLPGLACGMAWWRSIAALASRGPAVSG